VAVPRTNRQRVVTLALAQGISASGDAALLTAASISIFKATNSATAVSLLLGVAAVPTVLLGPLAGTFADWFPRRRILIGADLLSSLACLLALVISQVASVSVTAFVAIALIAVLSSFYRPAVQAFLPSLAAAGQLGRANSAVRLAISLATVAGPAAAAFMVDRGGLEFVLAVDAASFFASAVLVALIRPVAAGVAAVRGTSAWRDARAGLDYARRNHRIRTVTAAIGVVMLVGTLVNAGTLPLVAHSLGLPANRYGALLAIEAAGAMGLAVTFLAVGPGQRLLITGAFAVIGTGATTMALGVAPTFGFAAVAILLQGASVVALQVSFSSYLQQEASDAFRGRVMALVGMVASLAQLVGYGVAGPLVEWVGPRAAFEVAGGVVCLVAVPVVSLAFATARRERLTRDAAA